MKKARLFYSLFWRGALIALACSRAFGASSDSGPAARAPAKPAASLQADAVQQHLLPRDERLARRMMMVELGQGRGRERMEPWFQRAMTLNTNYYDACYAKLFYLQPKWHGSEEAMLEFAGECLNSEQWGGHVPLIILDVHDLISQSLGHEARKNYWKRPEVWTDVNPAFEKFFRLNPQETGWHHNYALYAYRAEQWTELNKQLGLLGPVNYDYFGGKEEFDKMVRLAKEHSVARVKP
jgi:hypothetical protein